MTRFVALLRGINVGGKNKLPMRDLAATFEAAGCTDVETYIQSGNVVYTTTSDGAAQIPQTISQRIAEQFGLDVPVIVRSSAELDEVVAQNPFLAEGADTDALHVAFLAHPPRAEAVAALDPQRSPPDRFAVLGKEVYLCLPNGMARTKLTNAYFDRALSTISTMRNWRTVLTLAQMASRSGGVDEPRHRRG